MLAARLVDQRTSPTQAARRAEIRLQVESALEEMGEIDREILVLRHFEHMTNGEAAAVLGIEHEAARKRHRRALKRLRAAFSPEYGDP